MYIEGGSATTEDTIQDLRKFMGAKDNYVTKYPQTSFDEYAKQLDAELARPIYYDDNFINFVNEMLGYKKEEVRIACTGKLPEVTKEPEIKLHENARDVDWDVVKKLYSNSSAKDHEFNQMAKNFKRVRSFLAENRNFKPVQVKWDQYVDKLGQEAVEEVKKDVDTVLKVLPQIDIKRISDVVDEQFQPLFDRMKDKLIDDLPELKQICATLEKETPLMKTDEYGLPLVFFNSPEFLDEFFPEVRDQIIEEIEIGWWDPHYRDERKKLKVTPESLLSYNQEWRKRELDKLDEGFKHELTVAASITEEARAFQQMYLDVTSMAKKNYELEAEVSQLKYQIEAQQEEQSKKEATGQVTSKKSEIAPEVMKILDKYSTVKQVKKEFPGVKKKQHIPAASAEEEAH